MPQYLGQVDYRHGSPVAAGALLVNLGTPEAPTPPAVRRFLGEFLSDPRIVETPRWLWWPILHGFVLRVRPAHSAGLYAKIWTPEGSPLAIGTTALATSLQSALKQVRPGPIVVRHAMRYGEPSIPRVLRDMLRAGVRRLIVLPLFPQYSGTTTASVFDAVAAELANWRWVPDVRFVADYHVEPRYIEALARSVESHQQANGRAQRLLLSFHGIPQRYFNAGDPYFCQCQATARALRERLDLREADVTVCFQSKVGREPWLQPYTEDIVAGLPREGITHVQVLCPGFAVDCLETLEEIALRNRESFLASGGEQFEYIPALNASESHVATLGDLILRGGQGWPEFDPAWNETRAAAQRARERTRHERLRDAAR